MLGLRQCLGSECPFGRTTGHARSSAKQSEAVCLWRADVPQRDAWHTGACPAEWGNVVGDSPGFDAAGVLAATVQEMQLRSCNGKISVFPAWPKGWQSEFTLMAEGGFRVTSRIGSNGNIPNVAILSRKGGICVLVNPWNGDAVLQGKGSDTPLKTAAIFAFPTAAGVEYVLTPAHSMNKLASLAAAKNLGPKWPQHGSANDTAEAYVKRNQGIGFLGITADGQNPARNRAKQALKAKPAR